MQRQYRLKRDVDFKQVRSKGRSWANPSLVLYALPRLTGETEMSTRVGISVSKRIGKAVKRNRVKRLIREAVRLRMSELCVGWNLVFIARKPVAEAAFVDVQRAVEQLLQRASLFQNGRCDDGRKSEPGIMNQGRETRSVATTGKLEVLEEAENRPRDGERALDDAGSVIDENSSS